MTTAGNMDSTRLITVATAACVDDSKRQNPGNSASSSVTYPRLANSSQETKPMCGRSWKRGPVGGARA
jgi:hypothetical protein